MDRFSKAIDDWLKFIQASYLPEWLTLGRCLWMVAQTCLGFYLFFAACDPRIQSELRQELLGIGLLLLVASVGIVANYWLAYLAEAAMLLVILLIVSLAIRESLPPFDLRDWGQSSGWYLALAFYWLSFANSIIKLSIQGFGILDQRIRFRRAEARLRRETA
ncbi:MAG: hypothetical protein ABL949_06230 [Fimbriimonadaceae bacterium]